MSISFSRGISFSEFKGYLEKFIPKENQARNTIFDALDNANNDENKENLSNDELNNFLSFLKTSVGNAEMNLLQAIKGAYEGIYAYIDGKNEPEQEQSEKEKSQVQAQEVNEDYANKLGDEDNWISVKSQPAVQKPNKLENHVPPKFPSNEYLDKDKQYQQYKQNLLDMDLRMAEIEAKYNMIRDDKGFSGLNIIGKPEQNEYTELSLIYKQKMEMFSEYSKIMENWKDEDLGENSIHAHNYNTYTHIEKITLKNGQHAYRALKAGETERKVYYPYWNGTVGGPEIPKEELE